MKNDSVKLNENNNSKKVSVSHILRFSLNRSVKSNSLILIAVGIGIQLLSNFLTYVMEIIDVSQLPTNLIGLSLAFFIGALEIALALVLLIVLLIFWIGCLRLFVTDEKQLIPIKYFTQDIFYPLINLGIAVICYYLIVAFGTVVFIIPGIFLAVALWFFDVLIACEGSSYWDSLRQSWSLTKGYRWPLFLLLLIIVLVWGAFYGIYWLVPGEIVPWILKVGMESIFFGVLFVVSCLITATAYVHILRLEKKQKFVQEKSKSAIGESEFAGQLNSYFGCLVLGSIGVLLAWFGGISYLRGLLVVTYKSLDTFFD